MFAEKGMLARIRKLWRRVLIFRGADVLVSHAPMAGVGDARDLAHRGFICLKDMVEKYRPGYFIHGHVHKTYDFRFRREQKYNDTTVINAWTSYIIEIPDSSRKMTPLQRFLNWYQFREKPEI